MSIARWMVTGASGLLGSHVVRQLVDGERGAVFALAGQQDVGTPGVETARIDLANLDSLRTAATEFAPTHVIHLGAMTAVGACHQHPQAAEQINVAATRALAESAAGARFLFSSTDMVFDGNTAPYDEAATPAPLSHYGRTKVRAEEALADLPNTLVVRIPLMYGLPLSQRATTFAQQIAALQNGQPLKLFVDEFRTPVWVADAARALIALAQTDATGLIHVAGPQRLSRHDLVAQAAELLGIAAPRLERISRLDIPAAEARPADLSLVGRRFGALLPDCVPGIMNRAMLARRE